MKQTVNGWREDESGLYCQDCATPRFGYAKRVFVDLGEVCVSCRAVVTRFEKLDVRNAFKWRTPTNLERMAFAVEKGREKQANQKRCKCRGPKRLCKCAGAK